MRTPCPIRPLITPRVGMIYRTFQGELRLEAQHVKVNKDAFGVSRPQFDIDRGASACPSDRGQVLC